MTTLTVELPESALAALRVSPADFPGEMRLAAAVTWYENGRVSQEFADQIAGLCRTEFLLALSRMGKPSFQVGFNALDQELARG